MPDPTPPLGNAAGKRVFEHDGKKYHVSAFTDAIKEQFSRKMEERALAAVMRLRRALIDEVERGAYVNKEEQQNALAEALESWQTAYDKALEDIGSGQFSFYSPMTIKAVNTTGGRIMLASLLFGVGESEMVKLMSERTADVTALVDVIMQESRTRPTGAGATPA